MRKIDSLIAGLVCLSLSGFGIYVGATLYDLFFALIGVLGLIAGIFWFEQLGFGRAASIYDLKNGSHWFLHEIISIGDTNLYVMSPKGDEKNPRIFQADSRSAFFECKVEPGQYICCELRRSPMGGMGTLVLEPSTPEWITRLAE